MAGYKNYENFTKPIVQDIQYEKMLKNLKVITEFQCPKDKILDENYKFYSK